MTTQTSRTPGACESSHVEAGSYLRVIVLAVALGLIVAWVSLSLRFDTRGDTVFNLSAVLKGEPLRLGAEYNGDLPFYNRILFPLLHALLAKLPVGSEGQWYLLLRIVTFQVAFVSFSIVCLTCIGTSTGRVGVASLLLALAMIVSFNHAWEEPSDALDVVALSLGVGASLRHRLVLAALLSVLFAANRESAAFIGLIWFALNATRANILRPALQGAAMCVASYGTVLLLRQAITSTSPPNFNTFLLNMKWIIDALLQFNPLHWLAMLAAVLVVLLSFVDVRRQLPRRLLLMAAILVLPALMFGIINELRVLLPTFLMICFAVAEGGEGHTRPGGAG